MMRSISAILFFWAFVSSAGIVVAENALPRVLILGDQIYQQPASELRKELKGKVEVHYPMLEPGEVWNSTTALDLVDRQLGDGQWDLIHFNCGLGDLIYRVPGVKAFRVMPKHAGGVRATDARRCGECGVFFLEACRVGDGSLAGHGAGDWCGCRILGMAMGLHACLRGTVVGFYPFRDSRSAVVTG